MYSNSTWPIQATAKRATKERFGTLSQRKGKGLKVKTKTGLRKNNRRSVDWSAAKVAAVRVDSNTKKVFLQGAARLGRFRKQNFCQGIDLSGSLKRELQMGAQMGATNFHAKKIPWLLTGKTGVILISAISLWVALLFTGYYEPIVYEMLVAIVLIRTIYALAHKPEAILSSRPIRKSFRRVVGDEVQFGLLFIVTSYILQWSVALSTVVLFLTVNLFLQIGTEFLNRLILRNLATNGECSPGSCSEKKVIVVGTGARARAIVDLILNSPDLEISIQGFLDYSRTGMWRYRDIPLMGHPETLSQIAVSEQVDAIIIAVETRDLPRTRRLFDIAENMGITVCFMPDIYRARLASARPTWLNGSPALVYQTVPEGRWSLTAKNIVDKVGAAVGLVLAAPIMILTALAIKLDNPGPILFKQKRSGLNGKPFYLYKFRTMFRDAEERQHELKDMNMMSGPVFKAKNDPRVTRVGRVLRKYSIDEIPQFFNVLRGDMSLVGPRPPIPKEVTQYEPWQRRRLSVKPGVTCLWQVNGRNNIDFDKWMKLDLEYIDNWSLWLDTKILARTLPAVIKRTGAS